MGVHKLTAGDGYTYLTRQVAVHDATDRGHQGLADYYTVKGESPGRWIGSGLAALDLAAGGEVTETHMRNLFGSGRHPDAQAFEDAVLDAGGSPAEAMKASKLGRLFQISNRSQPAFIQETARRYVAYNLAHQRPWKTPVPAEVRAWIRTQLGDEMFLAEHGRAPLDDRERGAFMATATRQQTTAVAGYDLTFAPVKSVSALWALATPDVADQVVQAHHAALADTLAWLEREGLFTRRGRQGVQQVKTRGLIGAMFTHRDARSGDPHLHTHVAVSNKVQDLAGRWLAIDGRVVFKANVALAEMYNTRIEAELIARLGVQFEDRYNGPTDAQGKRAVREIVGIDPRMTQAWAKRNRAIDGRRRELAAAFQHLHGRPPTAGEAVTLAQQAWEQTRQAKHAPRAEADQREAWMREAVTVLGDEQLVRDMVAASLGRSPNSRPLTQEWVHEAAAAVVARVAADRATWQVWHLRAEAQRQARAAGVSLTDVDRAVDEVVAVAISDHSIGFNDLDPLTRAASAASEGVAIPEPLRRIDTTPGAAGGEEVVSVYSLAGAKMYTSHSVVDAEQRILDAARAIGGRTISDVRVGIAIAEAAANEVQLNAAQQSLVREMATSGRAVQLGLAPAGTGKTTALQVLTRAWQDSGGSVIGLAPSAVAAQELRTSINPNASKESAPTGRRARLQCRQPVHADTLAKVVWHVEHTDTPAPRWMRQIDRRTLVLVDEAGMAATTDLAATIDYITSRGGQVRLIGDDHQLASVAAGGVLRDIAHQVGAITLSEVHRFRNGDGSLNHAEAAATLALREGDPSAIAFYADRGRIHIGDLGSCANQAYAAWATDRVAGLDSILVAPTRDLVSELNTRARDDRLTTTGDVDAVLSLADGTCVSAGDRIITRRNDRTLAISATDWVKNGDRWHVLAVQPDGSLTVRHDTLVKVITLPASYVNDSVQLGYATTVHGAQGLTTDTSHVVLTGNEDRNLMYVALSRGRTGNHLYLNVGSDGDPHTLIRREALIPPTAIDQLTAMLARDGTPLSASTTERENANAATRLHDAVARYQDAVTAGAEHVAGPAKMSQIDTHAEVLWPGLTEALAWPTVRSHLALLGLDHTNPLHLLTRAVAIGPLDDARDPAAVLDARIDTLTTDSHQPGPLPWLPAIPAVLAATSDWAPFLSPYAAQVADHLAAVRSHAAAWTPATAPEWAYPFLEDEDTAIRAELAVWRAVANTPDTDLRPTGPRQIGAPGAHQNALRQAVQAAQPSYPFAQRSWFHALPESVQQDPWITPLCQRLARLESAGLPVADYVARALAGDPANPDPTGRPGMPARPLPDENQAAALWWRLVPHLGPAALDADEQSADLLQPAWCSALAQLVGPTRSDYLQHTPAWPALVAAVDEACLHHRWTCEDILSAALAGIPQDGTLTGVEVADALVLRIALLTDQPLDPSDHLPSKTSAGVTVVDPAYADAAAPEDADDYLSAFYQDQPDDYTHDAAPADASFVDRFPADPTENEHRRMGDTLMSLTELAAIDPTDLSDYEIAELDTPGENPRDTRWEPRADPFSPHIPSPRPAPEADGFGDPREVPRDRLLELTAQALRFYESRFQQSWAAPYLRQRIGADLVGHPRLSAGYAPPGPRALLNHLTNLGATLEELQQAGLIRIREHHGRADEYVDVFRDRLILPIRDPHALEGHETIGFLGRRNPTKTDNDYAGPKYLNTKTTPVFTKREALFGYAEGQELLRTGALPVIVEGPMDALAITLGSGGLAVGVAPMGTALTVGQIKLLLAHTNLTDGRDHIAVAYDADSAGWKAAQTAYWNLTMADLDPTHVDLPAGLDPADFFETQGGEAIIQALHDRTPLADAMIDQTMRCLLTWTEPQTRQELIRRTAQIIAARGPDRWAASMSAVQRRLHLDPGILEHQTLTESLRRDASPAGYLDERISDIQDGQRSTNGVPPMTPPRHLLPPTPQPPAFTAGASLTTPSL